MKKVTIFCDGACSPNPGAGGWGAILRFNDTERELSGNCPDTTNNRMELTAAVKALELLTEPCSVTVVTDSQYLANCFKQGWMKNWLKNGWKTSAKKPVKNVDLWKQINSLIEQHEITWEWIEGHAGHPENERCDELAVEARLQIQ